MLTIAQAFDMAVQHHQAGRMPQAEQFYRQILQVDPQHVGALHLLGLLAHQVGRSDLAIEYISQALRLQPEYAEAHSNLGFALGKQGKLTEAVASYQQALRLKPDYAEAHSNLGLALVDQGRLTEAVASYQQALRLKPELAAAHSNLGLALVEQGMLTEAVASYQQALRLKPDYAEAHINLAHVWFLWGDFERAWPEYEWRWKLRGLSPPSFCQPLWDGSSLQGQTILLFAEQGLGDTFQFIRYAPLVQQHGATVIVQCQAPLLRLPRIFRTTLATIPANVPYLSVAPALLAHWQRQLSGVEGFKVGIAW